MKVEICDSNKDFEPIELLVLIETQEELDSLIAKLTLSASDTNRLLGEKYTTKERAVEWATGILLQKLELLKG